MNQIDGSSSSIQLTSSTCCPPLHTESSTDRAHITGYMIQMRSSSRKLNRPSTAPSGDSPLLPSLLMQPAISLNPLAGVKPSSTLEGDSSRKMQTVLEDDADISLTYSMLVTHTNRKQLLDPSRFYWRFIWRPLLFGVQCSGSTPLKQCRI